MTRQERSNEKRYRKGLAAHVAAGKPLTGTAWIDKDGDGGFHAGDVLTWPRDPLKYTVAVREPQ